jgi:phosphoglycerol transferase MdoB-like AlkP superfamily enzyme
VRIKHQVRAFLKNIWTKRIVWALLFLVFFVASSVALTLFLEYRHFMGDTLELNHFADVHTIMFIFNGLLVALMLLFLTGITGAPIVSVGVLFSFFTIITFIHINKFAARGAPLLPEDFEMASELEALSSMFNMSALVKTLVAVALALFVSIVLQHFINQKSARLFKIPKPLTYAIRGFIVVASAWAFVGLTADIRHRTGENFQTWEFLGRKTELVAWDQYGNYANNGFIVGFLYNLSPYKIEPPAGYDASAIRKIKQKYQEMADAANLTRLDPAFEDINIVMVLCESCVDMQNLEVYYTHTGGDITPNLHDIQQKYPHGEMFSPEYGGGTANVEFEALTGFSNYFYAVMPFVHIISKNGQSLSAASSLNLGGYQSIGLHAYYPSMYKRDIAYKNLGFSRFYGFEDFSFQAKNGNSTFINDASSYQETLARLQVTDQKMFISLVTMENHMPYDNTYDEHHFVSTTTIEGVDHHQLENYYESLYHADQALGNFVRELDNFDEKTVVLFYGDHLSGALSDMPEAALADGLMHKTPFFIYANFDIGEAKSLGTFSPNYLFDILLDTLNFQKVSRYYLLDDLKNSVPILTRSFYHDHELAPNAELSAYELVSYDLLFGKRYWIEN